MLSKLSLLVGGLAALSVPHVSAKDWAVIVAGSNGFDNYRHHADVCHSYHIASKWGIPNSQIITMMYDDVASDPSNPFPGKLFNKPTASGTSGVDVYHNCQKDYTGQSVTAANFIKVITGDATVGGKYLASDENDNVFINFVDHGGSGLICFPVGDYLYANDLIKALETMHAKKMYKKLVFYMEACESGSMFEKLIPSNLNIYVTTAANADESSWGTYCPPDDAVNGVNVGSCLGDLYSVNWMENSEAAGEKETLAKQFSIVQNLTNQSHVMQYGDLTFTNLPIGDFEGNAAVAPPNSHFPAHHRDSTHHRSSISTHVDSRDIELHNAYYRYIRANKRTDESRAARQRLIKVLEARESADQFADQLIRRVTKVMDTSRFYQTPSTVQCGKCCKHVEHAVKKYCGGFSDYALQYVRVVQNLCIEGNHSHDGTVAILNEVRGICKLKNLSLGNVAH